MCDYEDYTLTITKLKLTDNITNNRNISYGRKWQEKKERKKSFINNYQPHFGYELFLEICFLLLLFF